MSEAANDPPLVTRPADQPKPTPEPAPARPNPGFLQAVLWCVLFVLVQTCCAVVAVVAVFTVYLLAADNPKQFADEQLKGFQKALEKKPARPDDPQPAEAKDDDRIPNELGQSLAWGMFAAQFGSLGLILLVLPRRIGPDWKRQIGVRLPAGLHVLLVILLVPAFMVSADFIQNLIIWATGLKPPAVMKAVNGVFKDFPWPLTVLAVAVGPGVVEELWCRGFLGRGLAARNGIIAGVLLTSVLFSAMHLDPSQLFIIMLMGAYLHFVYLTTRSIWCPVLLHACNNGLAVAIALLFKPADPTGEVAVPIIVHIVAFSALIFGTIALWTGRAELQPLLRPDDAWWEATTWKPESPGISAPPPGENVTLGYAVVSPAAVIFTMINSVVLVYLCIRYIR